VAGIERDALDRMRARWRGRVGRTDRRGIGGNQSAVLAIGEDLFLALVGDDAAYAAGLRLGRIDDLERRTWDREVGVRVERLQVALAHVELFGELLQCRGVGHRWHLRLLAVVRGD